MNKLTTLFQIFIHKIIIYMGYSKGTNIFSAQVSFTVDLITENKSLYHFMENS